MRPPDAPNGKMLTYFQVLAYTYITVKFQRRSSINVRLTEGCLYNLTFKCSTTHAKRSFHRAINAIFGKIGRLASEEVILELVKNKCMPCLLYGLECYTLPKSSLRSLDFVVVRFLMKLFKTVNNEIIRECCSYFKLTLPSELLDNRRAKF